MRGEDEGKLTDLRQRETALDGRLQRTAREQHAARAEQQLTDHDDGREDGHIPLILPQHFEVDQHAHGDEEDGSEEVLHGFD